MSHPLASRVTVRRATPADAHIDAHDFTRLSAINTCPTWGIIRYNKGLTMQHEGQSSQALNAGSAAHDFFAAVRLWQLNRYQQLPSHFMYHGRRLFGEARFENARLVANEISDDAGLRFALEILYSSGYEDSPFDKRRTMQNIELACINYYQRWDFKRAVWVSDENDPTAPVGIEIAFDLVVKPTDKVLNTIGPLPVFRFTGRIDGIHIHGDKIVNQENKTASRMDDAWRQAHMVSHQHTGYAFAASAMFDIPVDRAFLLGMQIPQPRSLSDGIYTDDLFREQHHYDNWLDWVYHTIDTERRYRDRVQDAPMYTHSCNRYFRACEFIPYCHSTKEERVAMLSDMSYQPWSPVAEKTGD